MKFTQGYWMIKQNYIMSYATHAVRVNKTDKAMQVLSACRPITNRGAILDGGTLTVTFTAPRANIIRVKVTHFAGTKVRDPKFETYEEDVTPVIEENEEYASFTSGELTARVTKACGQWMVEYMVGDKVITSTGWRGMGRALAKDGTEVSLLPHGKSFMSDSLQLDVGEYVYGLVSASARMSRTARASICGTRTAARPPSWRTRTSPST